MLKQDTGITMTLAQYCIANPNDFMACTIGPTACKMFGGDPDVGDVSNCYEPWIRAKYTAYAVGGLLLFMILFRR